jgi:type I restriction enzyme S subunit
MPFPLPPLAEQERIAAEANRQLQECNEARESIGSALSRTAQQDNTILEAAALGGLVEPTRAKPVKLPSEEQVPHEPTLFSGDNSAAPEPNPEFADLMSRALPLGWRWIRVDQAGEIRLGRQRSPKHEYGENMFPYLRVANVFEDFIDTSNVREMNFTPKEQEIYNLTPGDLLLNEGQSPELVGRAAMYTDRPPKACFQNTLLRFRHAEFVNPYFALFVFRHYLRSGHFTRVARWSTNIAHLGSERLATMPFPLPPPAEQELIVAEARKRLDASKAQRIAIESSLQRVQEMRRTIIRSAVSGAIVPQASQDEPAKALLSRVGSPADPKPDTVGKERRMPRRKKDGDDPRKSLYETMVSLKGEVPPERLFEAAGYDRDSVADVERFYLALRDELGVRISETTSEAGMRLEVMTDAAR